MKGVRYISSDMYDALQLLEHIINALPDNPQSAEEGWQLFKVYQARDSLRAAYDFELEQEDTVMEGFY